MARNWIGGNGSATPLISRMGGTLTTAPTDLKILAAVLIPDPTSTDRARYTPDQYATLTNARTRVRVHVERLADDSIRAYGFYTGKHRDWENIPVVAAIAEGKQFVAQLGQGIKLILTPGATPIPVLKSTPALPAVWVFPPTQAADNILQTPVYPPAYQDTIVWFPESEIPPFYISYCIEKTCTHPDRMEELASYIAGEMNRNIHDPAVLDMRRLIEFDPVAEEEQFARLSPLAHLDGPPNFSAIAMTKKVAAATIWTKKVGQNQVWDHKPKLQKKYNGVVWHKQGKYAYYYDIWSNIHYGFIGIIAGLSESVLLDGAGAEQIASDAVRKVEEWWNKPKSQWQLPGPHPTASPWTQLRSWDDTADRVAISIGIRLATMHPNGGVTTKTIMDEVLAVAPENWGEGIIDHRCE
jgi:hypothetical protein